MDMQEDRRKRTRAEDRIVTEEPAEKRLRVLETKASAPAAGTVMSMRRPQTADAMVTDEDTPMGNAIVTPSFSLHAMREKKESKNLPCLSTGNARQEVTSLQTLTALILKRNNRLSGVNHPIKIPVTQEDPTLPHSKVSLIETSAPAVGAVISMRRPRTADTTVTDKDTPMDNAPSLHAIEEVLRVSELLINIGFCLSYKSMASGCFNPKLEKFWMFDDIKKFCLVSKFWYRIFTDKQFLIYHFPFLNYMRPEDYGATTLLKPLSFLYTPRFTSLGIQDNTFQNTTVRVSENGAVVCYNSIGLSARRRNVITQQTTPLSGMVEVVDLDEGGKTVIGLTKNPIASKNNRLVLLREGKVDPVILPFKETYGMSLNSQVVWGTDEIGTNGGKLTNYANGEIKELSPFEEIFDFKPSQLFRESETILGQAKINAQSEYQAAIWQHGMIETLPPEFTWFKQGVLKDQKFIGSYRGKIAEYKEGKIEVFSVPASNISLINNGLIVSKQGTHLWREGYWYSAKQLLKKTGYKLSSEDTIEIMDVSQHNLVFVGLMRNPTKPMPTVFMAVIPPYVFDEQNRVNTGVN